MIWWVFIYSITKGQNCKTTFLMGYYIPEDDITATYLLQYTTVSLTL